jgi:hypothetical protein
MTSLPVLLALILSASTLGRCVEPISAQQPPATPPNSATPLVSRCAQLAEMGSPFDLLGNACQYALSPGSLPNFVCEETIHRWSNGRPLDLVTAEVTFIRGHDHYSRYTIDAKPVASIEGTGGWVPNSLFGAELNAIFLPATGTAFKLKGTAKSRSGPSDRFAFQFDRSGSSAFALSDSFPGITGLISIDRKSGRLTHVEATASKINKKLRLKSYKSEVEYGDVSVPDLGTLLLPVNGQEDVCLRIGICYRDVASFHDCQKFGSEVKIIANPSP